MGIQFARHRMRQRGCCCRHQQTLDPWASDSSSAYNSSHLRSLRHRNQGSLGVDGRECHCGRCVETWFQKARWPRLQGSSRRPPSSPFRTNSNVYLTPAANELLHNSLSPATHKAYESVWRSYESFCSRRYHPAFPATIVSVTGWLASLAPLIRPTTLKGYASILRSYHAHNGLHTGVFNDPRIDLIIKGARRLYGKRERRLRLPLTEDILLQLLPFIPYDLDGLNICAAICVGFAAFLRSGEFTWDSWNSATSPRIHLARQHFKFTASGLTVTLPSSKTAIATKVDIYLTPSTSPLCPVSAVRRLISQYPAPPNSPAFSRFFGFPFTKLYFISKIHEYLLRAGILTAGFSCHSLQKGAAISANAKGLSKDEIKSLRRWKSDAVDLYINVALQITLASNLTALNSSLLLVSGPSSPASWPRSPLSHSLPPSPSSNI